MKKVKVGSIVRRIQSSHMNMEIGDLATVTDVSLISISHKYDDNVDISVELDRYKGSHAMYNLQIVEPLPEDLFIL